MVNVHKVTFTWQGIPMAMFYYYNTTANGQRRTHYVCRAQQPNGFSGTVKGQVAGLYSAAHLAPMVMALGTVPCAGNG